MSLYSAAHTNLISEFTVRFNDGEAGVSVFPGFDSFEDIGAIFAAIAGAALGRGCERRIGRSLAGNPCQANTMMDAVHSTCRKL